MSHPPHYYLCQSEQDCAHRGNYHSGHQLHPCHNQTDEGWTEEGNCPSKKKQKISECKSQLMRAYYEVVTLPVHLGQKWKIKVLIHYFFNGQAVPTLKILVVTGWHLHSLAHCLFMCFYTRHVKCVPYLTRRATGILNWICTQIFQQKCITGTSVFKKKSECVVKSGQLQLRITFFGKH